MIGEPRTHVTECASTQLLLGPDDPEGAIATTDHQTAGRGRLGRAWTEAPGTSALVSILLRPPSERKAPELSLVAAAAVALYLVEGAVGLPVFAGGQGSILHLFSPSAGFLLAFLPAAWIGGALLERARGRALGTLGGFLAIEAIVFAFGLAWLSRFSGAELALTMGLVPFLPGEAVKIAIAATVSGLARAWR